MCHNLINIYERKRYLLTIVFSKTIISNILLNESIKYNAALTGYSKNILEGNDIKQLAKRA